MSTETTQNNTITIEGRKLLVNSLVNGVGIEFTHFGIGDGEAPAAAENIAVMTHELFTVPVSKTQSSDAENGVTLVRGGFSNNNEKGDFYWRELGVYARQHGTENEPVLFGYVNYGEKANYIPSVGVQSIIEQGIIMQIVTGSANVVYLSDPSARATLQDLDDCVLRVEERLESFTQEHLDIIAEQVESLKASIAEAADDLSAATEGFVLKTGDTMKGALKMGGFALIGDLEGSAREWCGWQKFGDITELDLDDPFQSTMLQIGQAMPDYSVLHHPTTGNGVDVIVSPEHFPDAMGVLEVVKLSSDRCAFTFTDISGHRWHAAIHSSEPKWKGWILSDAPPVGSMQMFAGTVAPYGYLFCKGQSVSKSKYAALFAVIGYTYGGSGDSFKLPDFRGVFPRGFDDGRGVDSGRKLGTVQQGGAPNITGNFHTVDKSNVRRYEYPLSGAFYETKITGSVYKGGAGHEGIWAGFDASRSSSVYQNGITEVRPVNIAVNFIIKY